MLTAVCATADTVAALEAVVAVEGTTVAGSKGQTRVHPAVGELRQTRTMMASLLAKLAPADTDGRPFNASEHGRNAARVRWAGVERTGTRSPRP